MDLECSRKINSISFYAVTRKSAKSSAAVRTSQSFVALSRELASLDETAAAIGAYRAAQKEVDELRELLADASTDEDMRALAKGEIAGAEQKLEEAGEALKLALLPKDAADEKSVILEVRAGTGGDEASLFAGDLFRAYQKYAALKGWSVEIVSASEGALGGYKEIIAEIGGRGVYGRLKFEFGRASRPARAGDRDAGTHPHLRRHRRRAAAGRGGRSRHRRQGSADRHDALAGRRRPARQQDRVRRSASPMSRPASS